MRMRVNACVCGSSCDLCLFDDLSHCIIFIQLEKSKGRYIVAGWLLAYAYYSHSHTHRSHELSRAAAESINIMHCIRQTSRSHIQGVNTLHANMIYDSALKGRK